MRNVSSQFANFSAYGNIHPLFKISSFAPMYNGNGVSASQELDFLKKGIYARIPLNRGQGSGA
jgi:hypothetical protein